MKKIQSIEDLTPDPRNANRGTDRGREMVAGSLRDYGAGRSILADRRGATIAGNKTLAEARAIGMPVRVVETDGSELVVVQRTDLDLETDVRARELGIADNRASELGLDWDPDVLAGLGVDLNRFFTEEELRAQRAAAAGPYPEPGEGGDDFDTTPAPPEEPARTRAGDLWALGPHRLLVGDARDRDAVGRLLAGESIDLIFTDPPYGVAYEGGTADRLRILNDDLGDEGTGDLVRDLLAAAPLKPGGVFYVCSPAGETETYFRLALRAVGLQLRQCIVWVKHAFVLGRQDYHWRHESILAGDNLPPGPRHDSILYGWQGGAGHFFVNDRTQDTVWEIPRPIRNTEHPTKKPVELVVRAVRNSSRRGEIVYDACGGSGTTLIAAHRTSRLCRIVELDPRYADVILERFEAEAGLEPELLERLP